MCITGGQRYCGVNLHLLGEVSSWNMGSAQQWVGPLVDLEASRSDHRNGAVYTAMILQVLYAGLLRTDAGEHVECDHLDRQPAREGIPRGRFLDVNADGADDKEQVRSHDRRRLRRGDQSSRAGAIDTAALSANMQGERQRTTQRRWSRASRRKRSVQTQL